jgi:hypothetical protein
MINAKGQTPLKASGTITDTFRFSPMSFVETIRPLMKRGLIPKEVFDTIEREKKSAAGSIWNRWRTSKDIAAMSCTPLAFSCTWSVMLVGQARNCD